MATRNLNFADGQVAASATAIASDLSQSGQWVNGLFSNVSSTSQTLILTLSRLGGTSRRVFRAILDVDESLQVTGLPINSGDTLYAATTDASSVDYILSVAPDNTPLNIQSFNEDGILKVTGGIFSDLALIE